MADQSALNRAFADYARTIANRYEIADVLYRLTDQVVEVLGVDGAGVSIADRDGDLQFVTATDEQVTQVEERQVSAREGPCHEAYTEGKHVCSADLSAEDRWPAYVPEALEQGLRAVAGIPMICDEHRVGALNLYVSAARDWSSDDLDIAQLLADMATGYVVNARTLKEREQLANQLQHALDSRIIIEQAKGIIAERHGIDPAEAFNAIRRHARSTSTNLHDIARATVEGRLRL